MVCYYLQEKYVNPFTDFGFKRIFGEEYNKDILLDFLNQLLKPIEGKIKDLTYMPKEQLGITCQDRKAIFDLYCENERGEKFIVELQKTKQKFFKDRALYYSTFPITSQAKVNKWNFQLKAVYTIAILDFIFDDDKDQPDKYKYEVKLTDIETKKIFYDKFTFIYLEMPKFNKPLSKITTKFEKWMYVLKNLYKLNEIPSKLRARVFKKLFKVAEIAKFTRQQAEAYEESLKVYRDLKNSLDTAREEGVLEGLEKGRQEGLQKGLEKGKLEEKLEIAKNLLDILDDETIAKKTGLSIEQVNLLREKTSNKVQEKPTKYKPRKTRKK